MMLMNSSLLREPKPQQCGSRIDTSQKAETGKHGNQLQMAKARPMTALMAIKHLQSRRVRGPGKTRRYWRSTAILMKVEDKG